MLSPEAQYAKDKYQGEVASGYDARREDKPKWRRENELVREFLTGLPPGSSVLDVPVGTGRFLSLYEEMGFKVLGLDINADMLREAQNKAKAQTTQLRIGNAIDLRVPNKAFDAAVCIRLFRWISPDEVVKALSELQRVARKRIVFNARVANHPYARPMPLLRSALKDNWRITRLAEIEPHYLMFQLGCN